MGICWNRFAEIVRARHRFLLTSHVRPDCDALGSELALAMMLERLGKDVRIVNAQATPPNLAFLDSRQRIETLGQGVQADELVDRDVLIVLDTSAWVQLGAMADVLRAFRGQKLLIDHHLSEEDLGTEPFKDTAAEATGRLVLEAAQSLGVALSPDMATALFAAIATDTGWFRFASTTSDTYRYVAELVDAGAVPARIYRDLYEQDTLGRVRLRGLILSRVVAELGGRLAHTHVRNEDFAAVGALPSDTEDVINSALAIAGTQFAVILVEQLRGGFKVSFRSRCELDCSRLAEQFGGGGHRAAAGALVPGALEEAQQRVLGLVRAAFESLPAPQR